MENTFYEWNRVCDSGINAMESSGIIALGTKYLYQPMENNIKPINVAFTSCVPYFYGCLLICPGLMVYLDIEGRASENKLDLALIDGAFYDNMVVIGTSDGKILYGTEPLKFQEYTRHMNAISRVNECDGKFVLSGNMQISIMWREDSKIQYSSMASKYNFINAYMYNHTLFAYSDDGYLNIYYVDNNMKIDIDNYYRVNIQGTLKDYAINGMYVDHNRTTDIYFVCDDGIVTVIPDFNYDKESIQDIGNDLVMYAARIADHTSIKDMINFNGTFIIAGYGVDNNSCIKATMLKESIISHNILANVSGPVRYVYNFASTYESKYLKDHDNLSDVSIITSVELPVYSEPGMIGNLYIKLDDINIKYDYDIIDIPTATRPEYISARMPVCKPGTATVILQVYVNEE